MNGLGSYVVLVTGRFPEVSDVVRTGVLAPSIVLCYPVLSKVESK